MDAIKNYYETHDEENRLTPNHGKVEFITTMKYIHECLDEKPDSKIIEIGAATGRYSVTLAKEGYDVTAVDLVLANLDKLRTKLDGTEKIEVYEGNALDLSQFKDETFDITLVLGPMYHLFSATDLKRKRNKLDENQRADRRPGDRVRRESDGLYAGRQRGGSFHGGDPLRQKRRRQRAADDQKREPGLGYAGRRGGGGGARPHRESF